MALNLLDKNFVPSTNVGNFLSTTFPNTTPATGTKVTPIVTSDAATDHINSVGNVVSQSNNDIAKASTANATALAQKTADAKIQAQQNVENTLAAQKNSPPPNTTNDIINALTGAQNTQLTPDTTQQNVIDTDTQQNQRDQQNLATVSSAIDSMNAGTYPLTSTEKASVDNLASQYAGALKDANTLAQNLIGGQTVQNAKYGLQMYSPSEAMSQMAKIINEGNQKVATINTQLLDAQNKLTQAFQDQDYKSATDLYNQIGDTIKARTQEITDINTAVQKATDQMHTDYYNQITKPIQDIALEAAKNGADASTLAKINASSSPSDAISAAGGSLQTATGQLADYLQYKRDATANGQIIEDYATWKQADDAQTAKEKASEAYGTAFATESAKQVADQKYSGQEATSPVVSDTGATSGITFNAPASIAPYVDFSDNGVKYVDLSAFKGTPTEANQAVADAQTAGYKVITNKNTALDVQNISDAMAKLNDMKQAFDVQNTGNALQRDSYNKALMWAAKALQTNPDAVGTDVYQDTALDILKAMSGVQGFRGGASMISSVRSTFPTTGDTQAVVDAKISNIQKLIGDRETALVGKPSATDQLLINGQNAKSSVNTYIQNNPGQAQAISNMYKVPGATDSMIYQYLQQSGKLK